MEARQEVRLKEAEAADQKETANRVRFAEPTASIIDASQTEVQTNSTSLREYVELAAFQRRRRSTPKPRVAQRTLGIRRKKLYPNGV